MRRQFWRNFSQSASTSFFGVLILFLSVEPAEDQQDYDTDERPERGLILEAEEEGVQHHRGSFALMMISALKP